MITTNENTWNDDINNQSQGNGSTSFGIPDRGDTTNSYASDPIDDDLDTNDDDDLDIETSNEDLDTNDIDTDDDLLDDDDEYDEARLDDTEGGGTTGGEYTTTANGLLDFDSDNPDEIPEERQTSGEGDGYASPNEVNQQSGGSDTSFSEGTDVTPPNQHEFPAAAGTPQTDFTSRPQGRTTGRMVGHEPGTEGI